MKTKLTKTKFKVASGLSQTVVQRGSMLGSSYSDLRQCLGTELVRVGKRYPRRRDL